MWGGQRNPIDAVRVAGEITDAAPLLLIAAEREEGRCNVERGGHGETSGLLLRPRFIHQCAAR